MKFESGKIMKSINSKPNRQCINKVSCNGLLSNQALCGYSFDVPDPHLLKEWERGDESFIPKTKGATPYWQVFA